MAYLKDELQGFVPQERAEEIIKAVVCGSSILRLSKVEPMKTETKKIPVMTEGAGAYWVGETERIQTSKAEWIFPEMVAKKLAVIIPASKEKLNDASVDVFAELSSAIAEGFYTAIDATAIFGTNSPWAKNIAKSAADAGNVVVLGTNATLDLDVSDAMAGVEGSGFDVNGFAAHYGIKNELRKLRDSHGNQLYVGGLYVSGGEGVSQSEFYSNPIEFVRNGAWDKTKAHIVAADWGKSLVGIREGIEYEILREATLQNVVMPDGKPLSLAENDMVAIKATMRLAYLPIVDGAFAIVKKP